MWRNRYGGLETSDLVRLKQLEAENPQMERIIARQTLGGFADCAVVSASNGCDVVHLTASQ
jgi:hypothetical protein